MTILKSLNHITLGVKNIDISFRFYRDLLGFIPRVKWDKGAYFLVGDVWFCLNLDPLQTPCPSYTNYAFSINEEDFEIFTQKLIQAEIRIFKENTSPGKSFYFLDPDGHKLELHVGDLKSRLKEKKLNPGSWENVVWFYD